jgi:hypothetical protein
MIDFHQQAGISGHACSAFIFTPCAYERGLSAGELYIINSRVRKIELYERITQKRRLNLVECQTFQ